MKKNNSNSSKKKFLNGFFDSTRNIIILVVVLIFIIGLIVFLSSKETRAKYTLNSIYDVFPEEVRDLYVNLVEVGCSGDLYLNVGLDKPEVLVENLDKNILRDIVVSYLDKNDILLDEEISINEFKNAADKLIYNGDLLELEKINEYNYGNLTLNFENKNIKIIKNNTTCNENKKYISKLFGYSYSDKYLSVDVNMGYVLNNKVYDLSGKELGKYDDTVNSLEYLERKSYYNYKFVKVGDTFKLYSVSWKNRI